MKAVNEKCNVVNFFRLTFFLSFADIFSVSGTFEWKLYFSISVLLPTSFSEIQFTSFLHRAHTVLLFVTWIIRPIKTKTRLLHYVCKAFVKIEDISIHNFSHLPVLSLQKRHNIQQSNQYFYRGPNATYKWNKWLVAVA